MSSPEPLDPDLLALSDDADPPHEVISRWRILIVDDEPDVHLATTFALRDSIIQGRELEFLHAYNGDEALQMLSQEHDIAVVLLDVVMQGDNDGLLVADAIRNQLNLQELRIVLRTGHPGYAPEYQVIRDYGINDYKTKSDLSQIRLLTTLTTAIRSYQQLHAINTSKRGLELIVEASGQLFERRALEGFTSRILANLAELLRLPSDGLICVFNARTPSRRPQHAWTVASASGRYVSLEGLSLSALARPELVNAIEHAIRSRSNLYSGEFAVLFLSRQRDHEAVVYLHTGRPLDDIERQLIEVFCSNIAIGLENIALFSQLQDLAYIDPLCHVPNRTQLVSQLGQMRLHAMGDECVVLIDVDHFSQINDALGHLIGDQLLQSITLRLRGLLPRETLLARVDVDMFAIAGRAIHLDLDAIIAAFDRPFSVASHQLRVQITAAAAKLGDTEEDGLGCLKDVTIALNLAKQGMRGGLLWFSPSMSSASRQRLSLLNDLEQAIASNQLTVYYQPQIELQSGRVIAVEALVRWPLPGGHLIPPDQFIPLAEQSGLIIELGEWLLDTVCRQIARWRDEGLGGLRVAINVSMVQFNHDGLIDLLADALRRYQIPPELIEVEITESVAMRKPEDVIARIDLLKKLGVQVAIDDFGTGFSSLAYLQRLKADRLKIDRAFIRDMGSGETSIAEMVINLGHKLGIRVLAEGVEFPAQAAILRSLGCDEAQGYMYAKPAPADLLTLWLQETNRSV
ncbi:Cyclic di-GMP phosphodiesterase Gmr [Andreprevotia sp. IGB-42]|uniref:GGDEF/EAL domain-containing response regulator n=1 Tax=Andreprevotia sp. IGB-42 TaxID=2497473 RepID=UPI0013584130|nr:EAL domain-containing protein [Andreprevotia sp. IGB-42]KAF0814932.1 Cyclic di-GMP phosphodiesterase Gmr [Andreprevotia sp. IGB-42]